MYCPPSYSTVKFKGEVEEDLRPGMPKQTRSLHFIDLIETALHFNHKSHVSIELIKLMQNEVDKLGGFPAAAPNYVGQIDRS